MANRSLADFSLLINQQIENQRQIEVHLWYLDALLAVCLSATNFYQVPQHHLHDYFSLVAHLIKETTTLNQQSLKTLMQG